MTKQIEDLVDSLKPTPRGLNDHILIFDGLNTLIRSFSVIKTINANGYHVGGLLGFLKSLGSMNRMFHPTRIIVAWDGRGGAQNRKNIDANYKAQRAHASVIHYDIYDDKPAEMQSLHDQADRLVDYLACLPVTYVQLDKLEADDIIAYMAKNASASGRKVTIVSSDKDFMQLVDENIQIYSPIRKVVFNYEEATKFLTVLPENYNILKALIGDASDGLPGVYGVGIRGIVKGIPEFVTDPTLTLNRVFELCAERSKESKKGIFTKILADWHRVEQNYKLMDLHETAPETRKNTTTLPDPLRILAYLVLGSVGIVLFSALELAV